LAGSISITTRSNDVVRAGATIIANFILSVAPLTARTLSHVPVATSLLMHVGHHLRRLDEGDEATVQARVLQSTSAACARL
jgi:hypothetical protein